MKNLIALFLMVLLFSSSSCEVQITGCVNGEGTTTSRVITMDEIDKIDLSTDAKIYITEGSTQEIRIEASDEVINAIVESSNVDGSKWTIEIDGCSRNINATIYATLLHVESLDISGDGSIFIDSTFNNIDKINLEIDGDGLMDVNLNIVEKVDIEIKGDGSIFVDGVTDQQSIEISGDGTIKNHDLISKSCDVKVSGDGEIEINVTETLNLDISGDASICYKGNPTVSQDISGDVTITDCN